MTESRLINKDSLLNHMRQQAVIITPNNRLSNQLLREFYNQLGVKSIEKPRCLPFSAFLSQLFTQVQHQYPSEPHPILLTSLQERHLWREVLENHPYDGLLDQVMDAWSRCQQWNLSLQEALFQQTPQCAQFTQWSKSFTTRLDAMGAICNAQLIHYLLPYSKIFNFHTIVWACFDEYTPLIQQLQETMKVEDCQQYHYDIEKKVVRTHQFIAKDPHEEWLEISFWLKARLNLGDTRIAVVVPDLQTQYKAVQRFFHSQFSLEQLSISLGNTLTDYPIVTHALTWLSLGSTLYNHQLRLLLHSPYLAFAHKELLARSEFMQHHSLLQEEIVFKKSLIEALTPKVPKLASSLASITDYPKEAPVATWVTLFKTRLSSLGFPGDYPLNSITYQCLQRFMGLFEEFLQLSMLNQTLTQQDALSALNDLARKTIFQPKSPTTPIQILGLLEASGCTFDAVWVSGLTDQCLPQKTNLSAFIPIELQKKLNMPRSNPERELQFAQKSLQRLQYASFDTVFSFPAFTKDIPNLPSPLITQFSLRVKQHTSANFRTHSLILQEEHYTHPIKPADSLSGGTALLANQATCPFRGFAAHRLHAKRASTISRGPDVSERGQVLHQVMELIWLKLKDQHTLKALTDTILKQTINDAIESALQPISQRRPLSFSPLIQSIEHERLSHLVNTCIEWEKSRSPFIVEALEKTFTIELAGLPFQIRVDRLDRHEHDEKWVIDYKTSIPVNKPWHEERPEAPQLLLYALLDKSINTLLFIELKAGHVTCHGLSEVTQPIKGIQTIKKDEKWHEYQTRWNDTLTSLAQEFSKGHCPPIPNRLSSCLSCEFQNLCRT